LLVVRAVVMVVAGGEGEEDDEDKINEATGRCSFVNVSGVRSDGAGDGAGDGDDDGGIDGLLAMVRGLLPGRYCSVA
jgi:hypothetical protein